MLLEKTFLVNSGETTYGKGWAATGWYLVLVRILLEGQSFLVKKVAYPVTLLYHFLMKKREGAMQSQHTLRELEVVPKNDIILHFAHPRIILFLLLFLLFNYSITALLSSQQQGLIDKLRGDIYYHLFWVILIPLFYILVIEAYRASKNSFLSLKRIIKTKDPSYIRNALSNLVKFDNSMVVTVITAVLAICCVCAWSLVHTATSNVDHWWKVGSSFTPPGYFFLLMCVLVAWSVLLLMANCLHDQYTFLQVLSKAHSVKVNPEHPDKLGGLHPIQNFILHQLYVWAVANALVLLVAYVRRTHGIATGFDWLLVLNASVSIVILGGYVIYPVFYLHGVLEKQRELLLSQGIFKSYENYPVWPVDTRLIKGVVWHFISPVLSAAFLLEIYWRGYFR